MADLQSPRHGQVDAPNPKGFLQKKGTHRIAYVEWGSPDSQRIACCVHGMTRNARDFDYLAQSLAQDGYRVIAVDVAGRGRSDWLKNPVFYGYPLYVADMLAVLDHLQITQVDWIGTSMGGLIGMMIASTQPHRLRRMVLNDIGPFIPGAALMRIGSYVGQNMKFPDRESAYATMQSIMQPFGIHTQEHWDHLFTHGFVQEADGSYRYAYDPHIGDAFWNKRGKQRKMPDMDLWPMWELITVPMQVLRGAESDLLLADTAERMRQSAHVHTVVTFEGVGHAPMLMEPDQIMPIRDFLKGGADSDD